MLFALGFISGVLLCVFCSLVIRNSFLLEDIEGKILSVVDPDEKGEIIDLDHENMKAAMKDGLGLDESIDDLEL